MNCSDNPLFQKFETYLAMVSASLPEAISAQMDDYLHNFPYDQEIKKYLGALENKIQAQPELFDHALFALAHLATNPAAQQQMDAYMRELLVDPESQLAEKLAYTARVYDSVIGYAAYLHGITIFKDALAVLITASHPNRFNQIRRMAEVMPLFAASQKTQQNYFDAFSMAIQYLVDTHQITTNQALDLIYQRIATTEELDDDTRIKWLLYVIEDQSPEICGQGMAALLFKQPPFQHCQNWFGGPTSPKVIKARIFLGEHLENAQPYLKQRAAHLDFQDPLTHHVLRWLADNKKMSLSSQTWQAILSSLETAQQSTPKDDVLVEMGEKTRVHLVFAKIHADDE